MWYFVLWPTEMMNERYFCKMNFLKNILSTFTFTFTFPCRTFTFTLCSCSGSGCCCCCCCGSTCCCFIMIVKVFGMIVRVFGRRRRNMIVIKIIIIVLLLIIVVILILNNKIYTLFCSPHLSFLASNVHLACPSSFIIRSNFVDHNSTLGFNIFAVALDPSFKAFLYHQTSAVRSCKDAFLDWQIFFRLNWKCVLRPFT